MKFLTKANNKYSKEFGEQFDPDDFEKFYVENKHTDYDRALDAYMAPKLEEKRQSEWEKKIAEAKEEGRREARSAQDIPGGDITAARRAPLLRKSSDKPLTEDEKVDRFASLMAGEQVNEVTS